MEAIKLKIAVVIPYFGKWPEYFSLFLKSCTYNQWLDILFFTDCEIPDEYPPNVHFKNSDLKAISALAAAKLHIAANISFPYKLCDFKPCYGQVFEDYLKDYDFWGYSDIDLIYGNLKPFILTRIAAGYDVLSCREEILSGSLTLFRNTSYINTLFNNSADFKNLLTSKKYEGLDETGHCHITWNGGNKLDLPRFSFTYIVAAETAAGRLRTSFESVCKEIILKGEVISCLDGKLFFNDQELGYYHYVCNKNKAEYRFPAWKTVPEKFYITSTGFYSPAAWKKFRLYNFYRNASGYMLDISRRAFRRIFKT